jgi:diacylglycerol kinase
MKETRSFVRVKAFLRSFRYAFNGLTAAFRGQVNIKVQSGVGAMIIAAGFYFSISRLEWCVILLTIALVLTLEMMNTAIEHLVNLVTREWQPLAGKIKDIAAGAVLLASVVAAIVGIIIFSPYILS